MHRVLEIALAILNRTLNLAAFLKDAKAAENTRNTARCAS
jgi:hypothetical protein